MWFAIAFAGFLCVVTFALHVFLRLSFTRYDDDPSNIEEGESEGKTDDEAAKAGPADDKNANEHPRKP